MLLEAWFARADRSWLVSPVATVLPLVPTTSMTTTTTTVTIVIASRGVARRSSRPDTSITTGTMIYGRVARWLCAGGVYRVDLPRDAEVVKCETKEW